jgi:2-polyprenyl-3-methyl-5-hydroxy-6-metoxy-1,4-benzoquinol methylase
VSAAETLQTDAALLHCIVCGTDSRADSVARARIRSNVRKFAGETFALWQCGACGSVHAADEVDLDHYYAHYPFHAQKLTYSTRISHLGKLRALEKLGLRRDQRVLDYGCGGGLFVQVLQQEGYVHARGYDPYASEDSPYRQLPGDGYDVVMSQDVLEHVANPIEHLQTLQKHAVPGALLVVGTPNAALIDLGNAAEFIHLLHQPYHRHIVTAEALGKLADSLGMSVVAVKYGYLGSLPIPGINSVFIRRMLRAHGDTLDGLLAGELPWSLSLFSPAAIWDALTGHFRDPGADMTVVLRCAAS